MNHSYGVCLRTVGTEGWISFFGLRGLIQASHYGIMFEVKHMGRDLRAVFDVHYCNSGLFHTKTHVPRGVFITRSPPFFLPTRAAQPQSDHCSLFQGGLWGILVSTSSSDELYEVSFGADRGRWWQCEWVGWEVGVA